MKTRIYNVYRAATGILLLTAALAACTDSRDPLHEDETPRKGIFFSVTATQGAGAETRVIHTPNATTQGMDVTWAANDKIYVGKLPSSGSGTINTSFSPLDIATGGAGQTTAQFAGEVDPDHLPLSGEKLYAFYGKADKIQYFSDFIVYSYDGQRQTKNDNMTHAAEYDFMIASADYSPGTNHQFSFDHIGSMMKFALGGLGGLKVNKLTLSTYDNSFPFAGSKASVSLDLGADSSNGISLGNDEELKAYLMVGAAPKAAEKHLVLYATTTDGKHFATLLTGAEIAAGQLYTVDATLTEYTFAGAGTSDAPYEITNAGDLTKLSVMTHMGWIDTQGNHFKLTHDIDMGTAPQAKAWLPIGVNYKEFKGTFDGGSHSILNLPNKTVNRYAGLFGYLNGATIKNVTVSGEISGGTTYAGGIAGYAVNSAIEGCISEFNINISTTGGGSAYAGGIIGYSDNGSKVTNCTNRGAISSSHRSGGIIGHATSGGGIANCTNSGDITSTSTDNPAGGIAGYLSFSNTNQNFTLTNCTHNGSIPAQGAAGSIIGTYYIRQFESNCSITIKDNANLTIRQITSNGADVKGKWPETGSGLPGVIDGGDAFSRTNHGTNSAGSNETDNLINDILTIEQ